MKTITVKPILINCDKSFLYIHYDKLYNNKTTMHIPDGKQLPKQLILISLDKNNITKGDKVFTDGSIATVIKVFDNNLLVDVNELLTS